MHLVRRASFTNDSTLLFIFTLMILSKSDTFTDIIWNRYAHFKIRCNVCPRSDTWGPYGGEYEGIICWDVTPCSLTDVYRRLGRTYCLRLQGRRVHHKLIRSPFSLLAFVRANPGQSFPNIHTTLPCLFFCLEDGSGTFLRNVGKYLP
jgi:hypothetical protein